MKEYSKTFVFPKISFCGCNKVYTPEIELSLKVDDNKEILSICGQVWNSKHTDIVACGQCLDHMYKFLKNDKTFRELYRLWKRWHLNDMCPGTIKQEEALEKSGNKSKSYSEQCDYLKSVNLYSDDGYEYGSKWLYRKIDEDDLKSIYDLLSA